MLRQGRVDADVHVVHEADCCGPPAALSAASDIDRRHGSHARGQEGFSASRGVRANVLPAWCLRKGRQARRVGEKWRDVVAHVCIAMSSETLLRLLSYASMACVSKNH